MDTWLQEDVLCQFLQALLFVRRSYFNSQRLQVFKLVFYVFFINVLNSAILSGEGSQFIIADNIMAQPA
jgi:hypothetical protein